jgi:hypothetical protein
MKIGIGTIAVGEGNWAQLQVQFGKGDFIAKELENYPEETAGVMVDG